MLRPAYQFGEFVAKGHGLTRKPKPESLNLVRQAFQRSIAGVSQDSRALVAGLAIGDTSLLTKNLNDRLKLLSLTHLNAVSGANCAIVVGAVFWLLGFLTKRRTLRVGIAIVSLIAYVALVGGGASVVRAAVMAAVVLLLLERGVWPVAALSFTVAVMLIYDPNYATDYGFALSVFATAGILLLAPAMAETFARKLPKSLALALSVTVAAQLWCMPVLLELQAGVPTYAVLANLLAEPVVAPITILGIAAAAIAFPLPWLAQLLTWLASLPAQWIVAVAKYTSELPATTLAWHTGVVGMVILVIGATSWFIKSKRVGSVLVLAVLVVELVWSGVGLVRSASWLASDWRMVNCDVGQGDALVIRSEGQIAVVDVGREPEPIDNCLRQLGISRINLLVLTHFDADHIAGLPGALRSRTVDRALITPFKDARPLAALTVHLLAQVPQVVKAGIGTNGSLGELQWQVLSPTLEASEAKDSNDASLAMRWESAELVLYTMADLGEPGQMRMVQNFGGYLNHPAQKPLVLKVSHHGSADQYPELIEAMHPDIAIISVGKENSYGHPTERTLRTLALVGSVILRTDQQGAIGVFDDLRYAVSGGG
jgi:competence protein ComEC